MSIRFSLAVGILAPILASACVHRTPRFAVEPAPEVLTAYLARNGVRTAELGMVRGMGEAVVVPGFAIPNHARAGVYREGLLAFCGRRRGWNRVEPNSWVHARGQLVFIPGDPGVDPRVLVGGELDGGYFVLRRCRVIEGPIESDIPDPIRTQLLESAAVDISLSSMQGAPVLVRGQLGRRGELLVLDVPNIDVLVLCDLSGPPPSAGNKVRASGRFEYTPARYLAGALPRAHAFDHFVDKSGVVVIRDCAIESVEAEGAD